MNRLKHFIALGFIFLSLIASAQHSITKATIENYEGDKFLLADVIDGRRYVVNTYADWCGWCKREWEEWSGCIDQLKANYDIEFLVLATDREIDDIEFRDFLLMNLDSFIELSKIDIFYIHQDTLRAKYGVDAYPTSYIIDEEGVIQETLIGYTKCTELAKQFSYLFVKPTLLNAYHSTVFYRNDRILVETSYNGKYDINVYSFSGIKIKTAENVEGDHILDLYNLSNQEVIVTLSNGIEVFKTKKIMIVK